jgi:pyrroloquinoline quinone (PQQ) biosynthesis protein C
MSFHEQLQQVTAPDRSFLVGAPAIRQALAGEISRARYVAYLGQAWHHVRNTIPLMMQAGARMPEHLVWARGDLTHYLEEEAGHDEWILADIRHAGGDADAAARSRPNVSTDAMVAYAWDVVARRNPIGFFGMAFVLEGTSAALALNAAGRIQSALGLPERAFTYLRSHGVLDQQHVQNLASILDRLDREEDRDAVTACARAMFWLYGSVFRELEAVP